MATWRTNSSYIALGLTSYSNCASLIRWASKYNFLGPGLLILTVGKKTRGNCLELIHSLLGWCGDGCAAWS